MDKPDLATTRRLERLERVLAGRRARLAAALERHHRRAEDRSPLARLQRFGYPVAFVLAMTAVLPTVAGFVLRRPKLVVGAATTALQMRKLRKQLQSIQTLRDR